MSLSYHDKETIVSTLDPRYGTGLCKARLLGRLVVLLAVSLNKKYSEHSSSCISKGLVKLRQVGGECKCTDPTRG